MVGGIMFTLTEGIKAGMGGWLVILHLCSPNSSLSKEMGPGYIA